MKFACPKCGVTEIVIADDKPRCLRCRVPMIKAMAGYADLFMSPNIVIRRFETVMGKHGYLGALSGRVKQEREAWITAVWALGLREITKKQYWIEIETRDQTPDCKVHSLDQSSGCNHILTHNVEVVECDSHRPDISDVITQKCKKAYPSYFVLLVFARNGKEIMVDELLQHIQNSAGTSCGDLDYGTHVSTLDKIRNVHGLSDHELF
jgi:hypothetical protein